jgi:FkbM family methyltransferase
VWFTRCRYATACGWRGVAVEPVSYVHRKLCYNYDRWPRVRPLRAAVSDANGVSALTVGHGEQNKLVKLLRSSGAQKRRNESVPTLTLDALVRQSGLDHIDILVIDAEGAEERILASARLPSPRPELILFERTHLHTSQKRSIEGSLRAQGYVKLGDIWNGDPVGSNRLHTPPANRLYGLRRGARPE